MRVGDKGEKLPKYLLFITIVILSFSQGLKEILFGIPIVHLGNLFCVVLFVWALATKGPKRIFEPDLKPFVIWITAFTLIGTIGAIIFTPGLVTYLWGLRTYFRMFLLLFDCVMILEKEDMDLLFKGFNVAIVIHFVATLIEFFFFDIRWDYLNGIFGVQMGDSSSLHALILMDFCFVSYAFYIKRISYKTYLLHFAWMGCNAAMSEIRAWFFEIIVFLIFYVIISGDYKRMLKLALPMAGIIFLSIILMGVIYPYTSDFFGVAGFLGIVAEAHDIRNMHALNRAQQLSGVRRPIMEYANLKHSGSGPLALVTGLGLGSADYSTMPGLHSDFYARYEKVGYASFLLSFLYIETGILGLITFSAMWVYQGIIGLLNCLKKKPEAVLLALYAAMLADITFYNHTLRTNYGYIVWIGLGVVIVLNRLSSHKETT